MLVQIRRWTRNVRVINEFAGELAPWLFVAVLATFIARELND